MYIFHSTSTIQHTIINIHIYIHIYRRINSFLYFSTFLTNRLTHSTQYSINDILTEIYLIQSSFSQFNKDIYIVLDACMRLVSYCVHVFSRPSAGPEAGLLTLMIVCVYVGICCFSQGIIITPQRYTQNSHIDQKFR
jgi:hypothetical protein